MVSGQAIYCAVYEAMVMKAEFHPTNKSLTLLVSIWMEYPRVVYVESKSEVTLLPKLTKNNEEDDTNELVSIHTIANWNLKGDQIYIGSNEGLVTILDASTLQRVESFSIGDSSSTRSAIKSFAFSRDGTHFLVNSTDKSIRLYSVWDNTSCLVRDAVDKLQWKVCHFFGDDFVLGCSSEVAMHKIYIWNKWNGQVHKILEGPKESILDLTWHPTRTIFATCSSFGTVYIWGKQHTENWSAFAPDFTELEENEEYVEREDEFDEMQETVSLKHHGHGHDPFDPHTDIDVTAPDHDEDYILSHHPIADSYTAIPHKGSPLKTKHAHRKPHKKPKLTNHVHA